MFPPRGHFQSSWEDEDEEEGRPAGPRVNDAWRIALRSAGSDQGAAHFVQVSRFHAVGVTSLSELGTRRVAGGQQ